MAVRTAALPTALTGLTAMRWWTDALHVGMKECYAIARVERGHVEWWSGGRRWTSAPGSLLVQHPGDVCRDLRRDLRDGPGVCQVIKLPAGSVERIIGRARVLPQLDSDDPRGAAFHRLHDAVARRDDRLALEVAVAEAIDAFVTLADRTDTTAAHTRPVRRALELLQGKLAESVTLDDLAAYAGLDKFHLCRAFRAQVGLPPHAYRTRLRIARAKELLAAGGRSSDVAQQVGLYDQSQLTRHFRRLVGTTPARYARSVERASRSFSAPRAATPRA